MGAFLDIEGAFNNVRTDSKPKPKLVLFHRKKSTPSISAPMLNDIEIKLSKKAKYLGVIMDQTLNWQINTDERVKKNLCGVLFVL